MSVTAFAILGLMQVWSITGPAPEWSLCGTEEAQPETAPEPPKKTTRTVISYRSQWPPQWNLNGNWNANRDMYLRHLRNASHHRNKRWQSFPLESWSREQLAALHDDDHNGRVRETITTVEVTATEADPMPRRVYIQRWTASWCGPCRTFEARDMPGLVDVDIRELDWDLNSQLGRDMGIASLPSFQILDATTNEVLATRSGYQTGSSLRTWAARFGDVTTQESE